MKNIKIALVIILLALALYSGINAGYYLHDGYINKDLNENLRSEFYELDEGGVGKSSTEAYDDVYNGKFTSLKEINDDTVGWIRIPGTRIDYPVVKNDNNIYYLKHGFDKNKSKRGSIFMDYRNSGSGRDLNTCIYGHNMKDGSMFGDLIKYKDAAFFHDHPFIEYETEKGATVWRIFSVYVYREQDDFFNLEFENQDEYGEYILDCAKRSVHDADIDILKDDVMMTLLTCTYEHVNARLIIHAKLIDS